VGEGGQAELVAPVKALAREIGAGLAAASGGGRQEFHFYLDGSPIFANVERRYRAGAGKKRKG